MKHPGKHMQKITSFIAHYYKRTLFHAMKKTFLPSTIQSWVVASHQNEIFSVIDQTTLHKEQGFLVFSQHPTWVIMPVNS